MIAKSILNEAYETNEFKLGTAGYIKPDGTLIMLDEYHGEEGSPAEGFPEFSNTHAEEDTCVRLINEPTKEQYRRLVEIIDEYLDKEGYCKVEIWGPTGYRFYEVYSLYEDACLDPTWDEKVGNWTGYKLMQIIKNFYANHLNESVLIEKSRANLITQSKQGDKYKNGGSRWTSKSKCRIASTVSDYNKVDMDTFWKQDKLKFGVKVKGETGDYVVTVLFDKILPKIQEKIRANRNKLEYRCIYDALVKAINSTDVYVSCTCPDYKYRFKYWASQNGYEAEDHENRPANMTNPSDSKGAACKHILAVLNNVEWLNKIASVINNYVNYCKDNMQYNYARYMFPKLYGMEYNKAVQMTLDDYDENGEIKDELKSDEATINLINALGKVRGRIQKGSNKNPVAQKEREEQNK